MANTHSLFQIYNQAIKLSEPDRDKLRNERNLLRNRIRSSYLSLPERERMTHNLEFQSQGSYVMDTIIKPYKTDFDLDDGVYFIGGLPRAQRPETKIFHEAIIKAIDINHDNEVIVDKATCVRVKCKDQNEGLKFHIDLPIYYSENFETPELAHKEESWIESSPVEFIAWFEEKAKSGFSRSFFYERAKYYDKYKEWSSDIRKNDCQLRRVVRYLKSWADLKRDEMPCGIIMSILAANNYAEDLRDDISLKETLKKILKDLEINNFTCLRPTPKADEDLFKTTSVKDKLFFRNALEDFIISAQMAVENPNPKEACLKWKRHLGDKFPCHLAKDEIEGSKVYAAPAIKQDNSTSALNA